VTIRRGEPWGEAVPRPDDVPTMDDDAAASAAVSRGVRSFVLRGGDLARTMGRGSGADETVVMAPVDLLRVRADGDTTVAVAHVVARRRWIGWWRGPVLLAMNAQFLGDYDVAPRSHPNDGRVDVLTVAPTMSLRHRVQARRRARTGTHLPHPQMTMTQAPLHRATFETPVHVWVDGRRWRTCTELVVEVESDALTVHA